MHWTVRKKLYGLGALGLVFTLAVGASGLYAISKVAGAIANISINSAAMRNHIEASMFLDVTRADISKLLTSDGDAQDNANVELTDHIKLLSDRLGKTQELAAQSPTHAALENEGQILDQYLDNLKRISELRAKPSEAASLLGPTLARYQDLRTSMDSVNDKLQAQSAQAQVESGQIVKRSNTITALICICSSLLLFLIAFHMARNISARLGLFIHQLKGMAEGNLTQRVEDNQEDELGEVAQWFNQAAERLEDTMLQLRKSMEHVSEESSRLTADAGDTAKQVSSQREHINMVTHAMQDMAGTVNQVSEQSERAAAAAQKASETARFGGERVAEAVLEMRQIATSVAEIGHRVEHLGQTSRQITEITGVIDEISDQTGLLALNATIEAARAGEQGRGFAVVADEVRKLAERSSQATGKIADMIARIQQETDQAVKGMREGTQAVSEGVTKAERAGEALREIIDTARGVGGMVEQIATAATHHSNSAAEVNRNMELIGNSSRETGTLAEQAARTCAHVSQLINEAHTLVGQFVLREPGAELAPDRRTEDNDRRFTDDSSAASESDQDSQRAMSARA